MPYKDPERKRQWEREHREERNARRRTQRLSVGSGQLPVSKPNPARVDALLTNPQKPALDPISDQQATSGWKVLLGFAVGLGVVLLAAFAGASPPTSPTPRR